MRRIWKRRPTNEIPKEAGCGFVFLILLLLAVGCGVYDNTKRWEGCYVFTAQVIRVDRQPSAFLIRGGYNTILKKSNNETFKVKQFFGEIGTTVEFFYDKELDRATFIRVVQRVEPKTVEGEVTG